MADADTIDEKVFAIVNTEPTPKLRTIKQIAARLNVDHQEVYMAIRRLEAANRIKGELRKNGLETWHTDSTPPKIKTPKT